MLGEIVIRNPNPDAPVKRSGPILFESKEFVADQRLIPRELNSAKSAARHGAGKLDLFRDLVARRQGRGRTPLRRSGPVFWRRRAGRLSAPGRRIVRAQLCQGLSQHLAADAAGDGLWRDVQHVPLRPGGHDGVALGNRAWASSASSSATSPTAQSVRRRPDRIVHPHHHPAERDDRSGNELRSSCKVHQRSATAA